MNPLTSTFPKAPTGFTPAPLQPSINPTSNPTNRTPVPSQGAASVFAQIRDPTSRPPLKPVSPPTANTSQSSLAPLAPTTNPTPPPAPTSTNAPIPLPGPSMNNQITPIREGTNSRIELDYPIENVLIDANIPSSVAIKINDAVEKDRQGNPIHIHRYTFEPRSQEIDYIDQRQNVSHRTDGGFRRIREINPQNPPDTQWQSFIETVPSAPPPVQHRDRFVIHTDNLQTLQSILGESVLFPQVPFVPMGNSFEEPVFYYTARALPYDPMRIF